MHEGGATVRLSHRIFRLAPALAIAWSDVFSGRFRAIYFRDI